MIQIEFLAPLAPNAAPTKSAGTRAADNDVAVSFLSVLTRDRAHSEGAPAETTAAAAEDAEAEAVTDDACLDQKADGSALDEIGVELAEVASGVDADSSPGEGDDPSATHSERLAAAIDAADPGAVTAVHPPTGQVVHEEAAEDALAAAAKIRARQVTDQTPRHDAAPAAQGPAAQGDVRLPFRSDPPAVQVSPRPDQSVAGGTVALGGVAIESTPITGSGTAPRAGDALPMLPLPNNAAPGAPVAPRVIAPEQTAAIAMLPPGVQGDADPELPVNPDRLRATLEPRGDVAVPGVLGVPTAAPQMAVPFALFAGDGMRRDLETPARRPAYPADLADESAARLTAMNGATLSSVRPVHGTPEPALAMMQAMQNTISAEIAEGAVPQASGDELLPASVTTTSQTARGYPLLFAAAEPQRVTQQIAEAARRSTGGSIELALSPKELGSVRMSIQATETGTAIVMSAERDETMQLLRRHAEMLHDAFRDLGLGTLDLRFGGRDGKAAQPEPNGTDASGFGSSKSLDAPQQPTPRTVSGGLDLRM